MVVILHSEIRDIHKLPADVHYFFPVHLGTYIESTNYLRH